MTMYFFPTPYEDELVYSILARYSVQSGNSGDIQNIDDLFGKRSITASVELQGSLKALISNMPINSNYTEDYFIFEHTLFPYLAAFAPAERAKEIINISKDGDLAKIYNKIGLTAGSINQNIYFRFCPDCSNQDMRKHGETYWHRIHQVTGVYICPIHKTSIYNSKVIMRGTNRQSYIPANIDDLIIAESPVYSVDTFERLLLIAMDVQAILKKRYTFHSIQKNKYIYMERLIEKGIANLNTFVHQKKLRSIVLGYWGEEVLNILQCPININKSCTWLEKLVIDSHYIVQPLRHLLLARALDINIIKLMDSNLDLDNIKSHKEVWQEKLIELSRGGLSLREMAKILDSTPKTLKKHIERLEIEPFWKWNGGGRFIYKSYRETEDFQCKHKEARKDWLDLIKTNPNLSKSNLRELEVTLFTWLLRYDQEWLSENSPNIKNDYEPIHWEQRDIDLLPKVKEIVKEMLNGKPERICWSSIGGHLGVRGWLLKDKDRLPMVKEYIDLVKESHEDYQVRRISNAIERLENEGIHVTKWNIIEESGVNIKYIGPISDRIRAVLLHKSYDGDLMF